MPHTVGNRVYKPLGSTAVDTHHIRSSLIMTTELQALGQIIANSIAAITVVCDQTGKDFPSLSEPIHPSEFSPEGIRNDSRVTEAIALAVAAATQLVATLQSPPVTLTVSAFRVCANVLTSSTTLSNEQ